MNLQQWFRKAVKEDILTVLKELASKFEPRFKDLKWRKAVEAFKKYLNNDDFLEKDTVDKVINSLGFTDEVDKMREFWNKLPEQLRDITNSLENHKEEIKWAVLGEKGEGIRFVDLKGPLNSLINFRAEAELELAVQSLGNENDDVKNIGIVCGDDQRFLKMGVNGKLELDIGAKIPAGFLAIEGSGEAKGDASLYYYYHNKEEWLFLEALVHNISHLASPFDAVGIANAQKHRLSAIQLGVNGTLGTSITVSGGKTIGTTFNIKSKKLDVNSDVGISAAADISFDANLNLKGDWNLLVTPQDNGILNIKVRKDWSREKSISFALDSSIGISGLDKVGEAVIKKLMPDATDLLEKLKEYSNFGSVLKTELKDQLNNMLDTGSDNELKEIKEEFVKILVDTGKVGDLSEAVGNAFETALYDKLEDLKGNVSDGGNDFIGGIIEDAKKEFIIKGKEEEVNKLFGKLEEKAKTKLTDILGNIETNLKGKISETVNGIEENLREEFFKPLESVGAFVADFSASIDDLSQQLISPVIRFLTRYQKVREKIVTVVKNSSKLKIGMHFGRSIKSSAGKVAALEFELDTKETTAIEYYKEIMIGDFKHSLDAVRSGDKGESQGIKLISGSLKTSVMNQLTTDVSINIFGIGFISKTILSSEACIEEDGTGNIKMGSSKGSFKKISKALGEFRILHFVNALELAGVVPENSGNGVNSKPGITKIFSSGLTLQYGDKSLKEKELSDYLHSLELLKSLSEETSAKFEHRYHELKELSEKKMGAEISVNLALTYEDIRKLTKVKDELIKFKAISYQTKAYFHNRASMRRDFKSILIDWGHNPKNIYDFILAIAHQFETPGDVHARFANMKGHNITDYQKRLLSKAHRIGKNADNLVRIVRKLEELLDRKFAEYNKAENEEFLYSANNEINDYLRGWFKVRVFLSSAAVRAFTLAFIATIGDLCQLGDGGTEFLIPVVKWSALDWKEEIFV